MDLRVSCQKPRPLSPSDCLSDPEEKEVSDDDDDDRNHKHRRREAHSESLERDVSMPVVSKQFRKRNKTFGNQHPFGENDFKAFETLNATREREFSTKFERRRPGFTSLPGAHLGLSQRLWVNQSFAGDPGAERGTGREAGSWNQRNSMFHSIYTARGLPDVSIDAQGASWNAFGLVQGVPNGGLDMLCPPGLQGTHRPPVNSSLNIGIPRQRCRDFEERGFCLRGDMCPMEHGVNRIVIEDVQATGLKGEVLTEQAAKRLKMDSADAVKLASPQLSDSGGGMASPRAEAAVTEKNKPLVNAVSQSPKADATMGLQESTSLKQPTRPLTPVNRYKLDNRPTTFRVIPPLPIGLANASVLKEHFLPCGELSAIELDDVGVHDKSSQSEARISFTTRDAAERAFIYGKCWKDHKLKFMWLTSSSSSNDSSSREQSLSAPKEPLYADDDHPEENLQNYVNQEAVISGDEEPIDSEFKNGLEHIDSGEDLPHTPRQVSSAKQSPDSNLF